MLHERRTENGEQCGHADGMRIPRASTCFLFSGNTSQQLMHAPYSLGLELTSDREEALYGKLTQFTVCTSWSQLATPLSAHTHTLEVSVSHDPIRFLMKKSNAERFSVPGSVVP